MNYCCCVFIFTIFVVATAKSPQASPENLAAFSNSVEDDELLVVQLKDGTQKGIPKSKLLHHDSMHGIFMKNGELRKVESKIGKEEILLKENHGVANFIKLGRWAFNILISRKIVPSNCSLKNIKSLDDIKFVGSIVSVSIQS